MRQKKSQDNLDKRGPTELHEGRVNWILHQLTCEALEQMDQFHTLFLFGKSLPNCILYIKKDSYSSIHKEKRYMLMFLK